GALPATNTWLQSLSIDDREAIRSQVFVAGNAPLFNNNSNNNPLNNTGKNANTAGNGKADPYAQQNMQDQKSNFLGEDGDEDDPSNPNKIEAPKSPYLIQQGSVIPVILQTEVNSNLPGDVVARVRDNVYDTVTGSYLLIPKGSLIIGKYNSSISYGQEQVQLVFQRLVRPDGSYIQLSNEQGTSSNGSTGVADSVDNHWGRVMGAAVLSTLFSIPVAMTQNSDSAYTVSSSGVVTTNPAYYAAQSAAEGGANAINQVGSQIVSKSINIAPTIIIHTGKVFSVIVKKDLQLSPYTG
ncbi:MAG: hypothetical protein A3J38_09785, partial [Gammaproteobacteria bacterium RIFCSPHIGHO2_12_FULL_45_9]